MDLAGRIRDDQARAAVAIAMAAAAVGAPIADIAGSARQPKVAFARQVAMYLAYVGCGMSLSRVAAAFGRDRSTIAHACRVMEERRDEAAFDRWMDALEAAIAGLPAPL